MIYNIDNFPISTINNIYHISDIHIRNLKRHSEYIEVFNNLYNTLIANKKENDIACLCGDIVHSKIDISPELIDLTATFLNNIANILPTIIIAGNHDMILNNRNRLDTLTPIINSINNKNIFYLTKTAIYNIADKSFIVLSVADSFHDYNIILNEASDYNTQNDKIILYHGIIDTAETDAGYKISSNTLTTKMFNNCNAKIAMLGDIHTPNQTIQQFQFI